MCAGQEPAFEAHSGGGSPRASPAFAEPPAQATTAVVAIRAPAAANAAEPIGPASDLVRDQHRSATPSVVELPTRVAASSCAHIVASAHSPLLLSAGVEWRIAGRPVGRCPGRRAAQRVPGCPDAARARQWVTTHRRRGRGPAGRASRGSPVRRGGAGAVREPATRDRRAVPRCEPCARDSCSRRSSRTSRAS